MQTLSTLLVLVGLVVIVLGLVGVIVGKVPWLKRRGRALGAGVLGGGLALLILGGILVPRRGIVVTASPANATILLDGKRYTGTTGTLPLVADSYEVEVSAPNHHTVKQTLDVSRQQRFNIALTPFTAGELAAIAEKARQARLAKEAAARAKEQQAAAQAAAKKRADAAAAEVKQKADAAQAAAKKRADVAAAEAKQKAAVAAAEAARKQAKAEAEQVRLAQQEADRQARLIDDATFLTSCVKVVRERLKSPRTARFPGTFEQLDKLQESKDGRKVWVGWVDAENSFGADTRTNFVCMYSPVTQEIVVALK